MSKIFGDFDSLDDLNECARNLLDNGEVDDLKVLAMENGVSDEVIQEFIDGKIDFIVSAKGEAVGDTPATAETTEEKAPEDPPVKANETAVERLQREIKGTKNQHVPTVPIAKRLTTVCESDPVLAVQILLPHKSLEKCFKYVEEQARKKCGSGCGWIDNDAVYQMAIDYYRLDDAEAERKKAEAEKKCQEESQKRADDAKKRAAEAKKNPPPSPATNTTPPTKNKVVAGKKAPPEGQISLWGDLDG